MEEFRELLTNLIVYGDEKGWIEYNDGGVWVTDEALEVFQKLIERTQVNLIDQLLSEIGDYAFNHGINQLIVLLKAKEEGLK